MRPFDLRRRLAPAEAPEGVLADLRYGPHPRQVLDVHPPSGAASGAVVVLVHGGAWIMGDKRGRLVAGPKVARWTAAGCIVVSIDYRLAPAAHPLQQARDVARAIAFVQANASAWGASSPRLAVVAHSSGAHLAALVAASNAMRESFRVAPWCGSVLLDSAALDVEAAMTAPHAPFFDVAFGPEPAYWREVSPLARVRGRFEPTLVVHAQDRPDSSAQAERFVAAVRAAGGSAQSLAVPLGHAEIASGLGAASPYTHAVEGFLADCGVPGFTSDTSAPRPASP